MIGPVPGVTWYADHGAGDPADWPTALSLPGAGRDQALQRLHSLMLKAARHQVWRMRGMLPGAGVSLFEDLANTAADEALTAVLAKLDTFEGRSRFTTWAYKFAILQAATEVRRQSWATREVSLDDTELWSDRGPSPEQQAEASDLAAAVAEAMYAALTPYQRRIAVALLVDNVPIDVLAERLGTTRGALYKALHEARSRLRAHLTASGHLNRDDTPGGDR
jgi:RNA polymerase sigma-70 factor (ECF subfamily)